MMLLTSRLWCSMLWFSISKTRFVPFVSLTRRPSYVNDFSMSLEYIYLHDTAAIVSISSLLPGALAFFSSPSLLSSAGTMCKLLTFRQWCFMLWFRIPILCLCPPLVCGGIQLWKNDLSASANYIESHVTVAFVFITNYLLGALAFSSAGATHEAKFVISWAGSWK